MTTDMHAKDRQQAGTLLAITLSIAGYLLVGPIRTGQAETAQLQARTDQLYVANRRYETDSLQRQIDSLRQVLGTASDKLMTMETQLPSPAELPLLLSEIADHARRSTLTVLSVSPAAPVVDSPIVRYQYALAVRGSVTNIRRFVQGLTALPRTLGIDALELETVQEHSAQAMLSLRTATMHNNGALLADHPLSPSAPITNDRTTGDAAAEQDEQSGQRHAALALTLLAIVHAGHTAPVRAVLRDSVTGERWTVGIGDRVGSRFVHAIHATSVVLAGTAPAGMRMDTVRWPTPERSHTVMRTVPTKSTPKPPLITEREPLP